MPAKTRVGLWILAVTMACTAAPPRGNPAAGGAGDIEEVGAWPPVGGRRPQFGWRPMRLDRRVIDEDLGPDGTVTRREEDRQVFVTAAPGGGVEVSFPEAQPPADATPFVRAMSRAYGLLRIVTRPDGQIDHLAGVEEFTAAVKADPDSVDGRALFDKPGMREVLEASVEENYVAWIVTVLDIRWVPEPGRAVRHTVGDIVTTLRTEDLGHEAPGRVRLRIRVEGPGPKISVHRTFLTQLVPAEHFAASTGFWQIELVTDLRDLIPVRAVVEKELRAGRGGEQVRGWSRATSIFTVR